MWLDEHVERTAWIANARQESCPRNIERSKLLRTSSGHDPGDRGCEIIDLKQHLPSWRRVPVLSDGQQSPTALSPIFHTLAAQRERGCRAVLQLPAENLAVEASRRHNIARVKQRRAERSCRS